MIASSVPLAFIVAAIVGLGATGNLFSFSPLVIAVQIAAVGLNIWARSTFKRGTFRIGAHPGGSPLITHGPYRFIRHPMYCALLLFIWAGVASHLSLMTIAVGIAVTALAIVRVVVEERLLRANYPDYLEYSRSTKALIPFVF